MSVNAGDRINGKFEVITKSRKLASYTIRICCNEHWFPQQFRNAITDRIVNIATDIFVKCWTANNTRIDDNPDKAQRRSSLQLEAHDSCNELLALVQIAQEVFHLRTNRMKYWGNLIIETRGLIKSWHEKDRKRQDL